MEANLVSITPNAESFIAWAARTSSSYRDNPEYSKLFRHLLDNKHWSPFEQASASFEIVTSRAIAAQILRHRFAFQERSQRYIGEVLGFEYSEGRRQAAKNRQSSTDDLSEDTKVWWQRVQEDEYLRASFMYEAALQRGICREQARMLLPLATQTSLVMTGNIRSWIHYVEIRTKDDTQREHYIVALKIKEKLAEELPIIASVLGWTKEESYGL